jgi:hypothetical protein
VERPEGDASDFCSYGKTPPLSLPPSGDFHNHETRFLLRPLQHHDEGFSSIREIIFFGIIPDQTQDHFFSIF